MPIPDGWQFSVQTVGPTLASITVPAPQSGLRNVLTHLTADYLNFDGVVAQAQVRVFDGGTQIWARNLATPLAPVGQPSEANIDPEVSLIATIGTVMVVTFSVIGGTANYQQFLQVNGHCV